MAKATINLIEGVFKNPMVHLLVLAGLAMYFAT